MNNGNRYVLVANRDEALPVGVLDRVTGEVALGLNPRETRAMSRAGDSLDKTQYMWTPAEDVEVLGELGPVPERIKPPFRAKVFPSGDGGTLTVDFHYGSGGQVMLDVVRHGRGHAAYLAPEQAPVVASAILRAAGVDPESVDWAEAAKGGE